MRTCPEDLCTGKMVMRFDHAVRMESWYGCTKCDYKDNIKPMKGGFNISGNSGAILKAQAQGVN